MRIIVSNRNKGKTMKAIQLAMESGAYLVVQSVQECSRIRRLFPKFKRVISFDQFVGEGLQGVSGARVVIDNADNLLRYIAKSSTIEAITVNGTAEGPVPDQKYVEMFDPKRQYKRGDYVKFLNDSGGGAVHLVTTEPPRIPLEVGIDTAFYYCW